MSRWRSAFDRIGGPDAVTWPAFWITFGASLIGHLTTGGSVSTSLVVRVLVVGVAQLAMFAPLVLLRVTALRDPSRPRPWVAVMGYMAASVLRGVVLTGLLIVIDAVEEPLWLYRVTASLLVQGTILMIVALVVSTIRANTRSLRHLMAIQRKLEATQERIVNEVADRSEEALVRVKSRLVEEMVALDSLSGNASVAELQRLASDVVRPMSHELAVPQVVVDPTVVVDDVHVTRQQVVAQMTTRSPLRPISSALLMALILVTAAAGVFGSRGLSFMMAVVGSVLVWSWLGNRLLALVLRRASPDRAIVTVVLISIVIGYLSAGAGALILLGDEAAELIFLAGGAFVAGVIVLLAIVNAVLLQQAIAEQDLAEHTTRLQRAVVRLRQAQWFQGQALSRALHGPVQAAVTSAALRLDAALRSGQPTDLLVLGIRSELAQVVDVLDVDESQTLDIDDSIARIRGTWDGLCSVNITLTAAARSCLQADPVATAIVRDLLAEAVSNAVRHGEATVVEATVADRSPDDLFLRVRDNGAVSAPWGAAGLGTTLLDACTVEWGRSATSSEHVLWAIIPVHSTAP